MIGHVIGIFLLSISIALSCFSSEKQDPIDSLLKLIPAEDKEQLEAFFRYMITHEGLGYVIFGDKPLVGDGFYPPVVSLNLQKAQPIHYDHLSNSYAVWLKYFSMFPMQNYAFRTTPKPNHYKNSEADYFIFINKKACSKAIKDHIELFRKRLGPSITPEKILNQLTEEENGLEDVLKGHEDLIGILFGFGKHNSESYQKRDFLYQEGKDRPPYDFHKMENIYPLTHFNSKTNYENIIFIDLPCFIEDRNHPESLALRKKYVETQKQLCEIYSQGKFLEPTLRALMQEVVDKLDFHDRRSWLY